VFPERKTSSFSGNDEVKPEEFKGKIRSGKINKTVKRGKQDLTKRMFS